MGYAELTPRQTLQETLHGLMHKELDKYRSEGWYFPPANRCSLSVQDSYTLQKMILRLTMWFDVKALQVTAPVEYMESALFANEEHFWQCQIEKLVAKFFHRGA